MVGRRVGVDDGEIQVAAFLRLTCETMILGNQKWRSPAWRWEVLKEMHEDMRRKAQLLMLDDAHCWVPPQIEKSFGKRLISLGWEKERPWPVYSTRVF